MEKTFIKRRLFACIAAILAAASSFAQTITTGAVSPAAVCAGNSISVPFTTTGTFVAGNVFTIELSTAAGAFPGTFLATTGTASPLTAVVPAATVPGAAYTIRVTSSNPVAATMTPSAAFTVNAIPANPTFTAPPSYVTGAVAAPLTASGSNLLWYSAATGGTGSATAPTPTTTAAGTQSFFVSQTVGTCESGRAQIDVVVTACTAPAAPTVAPVAYTVGQTPVALTATGTGLLWYTAATGGTGSPTAPTPTTTAAGTQNFWVTQTVSACESPRAQITVTVSACTPPPAPTVAPVAYTVGQTPVALTATGTGLLWYTAATGGTGSPTAPTPTTTAAGTQNFWVTQTVSACESPRANIVVTVTACTPPVAPTVAPVAYTVGQTPVALTATGTGLLWYTAATGGTGSPTAPTPTTTAAGTQNFWVTQTVSACESPRANIVVTVTACTPPVAPTVAPVAYTVGQTPVALTATGTGLLWYAAATGGTGSPTAPTPTTTAAGTQNFWVTQTVSACESPRAQITVTVSACTPPPAPTVAPVAYRVGQTPVALTATGTGLLWYTTATGGTGSATAPTPTTTAAGTQNFWVTQTVSACESPRAQITVTVSACALSAAPTITSATTYCATTAAIPALTATGTAIKWYNASGGLIASAVPNGNVSVSEVQTFYVTQTETGKCESPKKFIEIIINKTPLPVVSSTVVEYCLNSTATALTATGTALKWYASTTGTTEISPIPVTTTAGNLVFYVSQSLYGCEGDRARIDVKIKTLPAVPTVTTLAAVCENTTVASTVLSGAVTPQTGLLWYTAATGGTGTSSVPAIVTTTAGIKNYYVTQTADGCESATRAILALDVKAQPAAPTVAAVPYCKDVTNATALTATGTGLKWYNGLTGGTALTAAPVPSTATVGTASYYVSQTTAYTGLSCEGPRAKLDVITNPLPANLTAASEALCQERADKTYTFSATPTLGNTISWYSALTGGSKETAVPPTVNLKNAGETTFYSTQVITATGCESPVRAAIKIRVKPLPAVPSISAALIEYCQFVAASPLSATPVSDATLDWYGTSAAGGTASGTAPTPSTANGGTTSYYVAQTLEACASDRTKIDVKINTTPLPVTQTSLAYCQNETAPILDATGTVLKWYRTADGGPNDWQGYPYTPYTGKVEDYSFFVTQTGLENKCESPKQEIKIHIKALPSATLTGNTTIDLGQSATLSLAFTGDGPWKYILSHGVTNTTTQSTVTEQVTPLTTTTYFVTEISNSCGKGSPVGTVLVTVRIPTITSGSPSVAEACAGKTFTVPFQQSGDYPAGNTFKVQIALTNEDAKFYTIPSVATSNLITATFPDTTAGGNYFVRVVSSGTNPAFFVRGSVSPLGITASPLPVATISGAQTVLMGDPATLKVDITGKSPWTFSLNNGVKDSLITATTASYTFKITPKATTTYTITSATNGCGIGKGAGSARVQVDPILAVEPVVTNWVTVYPTIAETLCTVEISGALSPKDAKVEVIDLTGRPVFEQVIRQKTTELDFSKYPSGLYLLRVQNGNLRSVNKVMKR
ncbi:Ig-like domain-containing protein [Dyadobacter psychrotolerans]|uniref:T9SS type A sorting domain-containing protein n=1 Tax=Dyadobacter psychrotolerans TaxID=2541721 RepID=A0A4R5DK20_9BACT|nr:T9SS type A sorting domain-containing protein [Dyadobacter psychrotolerans]TDE12321.1 T9SS type A sorting domain-containing protein [Dyadobacter psychrotolerans]